MFNVESIASSSRVHRLVESIRKRRATGGALLASIVLGAPAAVQAGIAPPHYTLTELGTLGNEWGSVAYGINNSGQVIGKTMSDPGDSITHAFLYSGGTMHDLGTLGGNTIAYGINDSGQIVGASYLANAMDYHPFLYSDGSMHDLGTLGGPKSAALAINATGEVVGASMLDTSGPFHAFLYSGGTMHDLGTLGSRPSNAYGINSAGQVVGQWENGAAFLYTNGAVQTFGSEGIAYGINDLGQVVGALRTAPDQPIHAFLYSDGNLQDLGSLGQHSAALAINDNGQIVGTYDTPGQGDFLYTDGTMYDLGSLVLNAKGYVFGDPTAINDRGQIVGECTTPSGRAEAFLLTPTSVPLPDAVWMGLGTMGLLAGCALCRQRRVRLG